MKINDLLIYKSVLKAMECNWFKSGNFAKVSEYGLKDNKINSIQLGNIDGSLSLNHQRKKSEKPAKN